MRQVPAREAAPLATVWHARASIAIPLQRTPARPAAVLVRDGVAAVFREDA